MALLNTWDFKNTWETATEIVASSTDPQDQSIAAGATTTVVYTLTNTTTYILQDINNSGATLTSFRVDDTLTVTVVAPNSPTPVIARLVLTPAYNGTNGISVSTDINIAAQNPDTVIPVITLLGDSVVNVVENTSYTDAGATALDDRDGDITSDIVVTNPVVIGTTGAYTVRYNVQDEAGNSATEVTRTVNVIEQANVGPTANAGNPQTNIAAGATVTLNGSGSVDSDGTITTYLWTPPAGIVLSNVNSIYPTFTAPTSSSNQNLIFSLVVTDDDGLSSAPSTVTIGVMREIQNNRAVFELPEVFVGTENVKYVVTDLAMTSIIVRGSLDTSNSTVDISLGETAIGNNVLLFATDLYEDNDLTAYVLCDKKLVTAGV